LVRVNKCSAVLAEYIGTDQLSGYWLHSQLATGASGRCPGRLSSSDGFRRRNQPAGPSDCSSHDAVLYGICCTTTDGKLSAWMSPLRWGKLHWC